MRRIAALLLLVCVCSLPAVARKNTSPKAQAKSARNAVKKQQKAQKKYAKAQRKAQRKMEKYDRKHTHDPNRPK